MKQTFTCKTIEWRRYSPSGFPPPKEIPRSFVDFLFKCHNGYYFRGYMLAGSVIPYLYPHSRVPVEAIEAFAYIPGHVYEKGESVIDINTLTSCRKYAQARNAIA